MKVMLTGGTGLIGAHIAARLVQSGREVRLLVRDPDTAPKKLGPLGLGAGDVEIFSGDILDRDSVRAALAGCDAAIHAAGRFSDKLEDAALLRRTNLEGSDNFLDAAVRAGVDPAICISSIGALFPPASAQQKADDPVTAPKGMYARTKAAAERLARAHQARGAPVVTVYPGAVHGPNDPTFSVGPQNIADFVRKGTVLVTAGGLAYTDARDVGQLVDRALVPGLGPRRFMFGGNYLSHAELHVLLCDLTGRSLKALKVPGGLLRAMGRAADLFGRVSGRQFRLTFEAAEVLTRSVPCDDQPTVAQLGISPTGARDSFRDLLIWMHQAGILSADEVGPELASAAARRGENAAA